MLLLISDILNKHKHIFFLSKNLLFYFFIQINCLNGLRKKNIFNQKYICVHKDLKDFSMYLL